MLAHQSQITKTIGASVSVMIGIENLSVNVFTPVHMMKSQYKESW